MNIRLSGEYAETLGEFVSLVLLYIIAPRGKRHFEPAEFHRTPSGTVRKSGDKLRNKITRPHLRSVERKMDQEMILLKYLRQSSAN